jgi:hypothetical protein
VSLGLRVEAAGIEPASGDIQREVSTCLSSSSSRSKVSDKERHSGTSPDQASLARVRTALARYPASRRLSNAAGERKRNGIPTSRQLQAVVLHLVCFHLFTRWVEPRHATSASLSPSNPIRPRNITLNYRGEDQTLSTQALSSFGVRPLSSSGVKPL